MADDVLHYNTQPTHLAATGTYYPLRFRIGPPDNVRIHATAGMILRSYYRQAMSISRWRKVGWLVMRWRPGSDEPWQISRPFDWNSLCRHLRDQEEFTPEAFNLPKLLSSWLDAAVIISPRSHAPAIENERDALTFYVPVAISEHFPVRPRLDREGRAFSSLQIHLLQSWYELRTRLVANSDGLFDDEDWLRDLFAYLNTVIAAVDNTLHQVYYRAKYEANTHGWRFDAEAMGRTHGRRLDDKLRWIGQVTGRPLHDRHHAVARLKALKEVRNHISHFDPPALAFSIEDVADWLNATQDVALLLAAIRERLDAPICESLVPLLLARPVDWYPFDPGRRRAPQSQDTGYASSCWSKSTDGQFG